MRVWGFANAKDKGFYVQLLDAPNDKIGMWQIYVVEDTTANFPMDDAYARGATHAWYLNTEDLIPIEPIYA